MASRNSNGSQTNLAPPPQGPFRLRHFAFVACLGLVSGAVWIGGPVAVWKAMVHCEGASCLSLEADLRRSQDPSVKPCDDFYGHVCGRWPEVERVYMTPAAKYDSTLDVAFLRDAIFSTSQRRSRRAGVQDVLVDLLVTCHTQQPDEAKLQWFLTKLRLPWPAPSATSELELLDMIAGASLVYNVPVMWIFAVGRHLRRPRENALYVMLDPAVNTWMQQVTHLAKRRTLASFLRRCAERVGAEGQSYDSMIRNFVTTHREVQQSLSYRFDIVVRPEYINFRDVRLRQAVNRHLPDESQQWPEDSVICLQRVMFRRFRRRHLVEPRMAAAFKNYAGAYLVWYLAPYVSPYLTASLMEDLGRSQRLGDFVRSRCSALIRGVLPVVLWKAKSQKGTAAVRDSIFATYAMLRSVMEITLARHDRAAGQRLSDYADTLSINFYNMSVPWNVLDLVYAGVPQVHGRNLFEMYQAVASHSLQRLKRSMRKPNTSVHVPHLAPVGVYRALAAREIRIPLTTLVWPTFDPRYPLAARMAGLGVEAARNLVELAYYAFFIDNDLRPRHPESSGFPPSMLQTLSDLYYQLGAAFTRIGDATLPQEELEAATKEATALELAHAASKALQQAQTVTLARRAEDARERPIFFATLAPDELFFRLSCFYHCASRERLHERVMCNYAVPRLPGFASVFNCTAGDAMFVPNVKYTWS